MQPEVGVALPRTCAGTEKAPPDYFAPSRRPHAPARSTESGLPSRLNTPRPRCTPESPPLGPPPSTVLCTGRVLHLYTKLHLHPAPESRYSPHVVSKRVASLQALQSPRAPCPAGASAPKSAVCIPSMESMRQSTQTTPAAINAGTGPREAKHKREAGSGAGINAWRTLVASCTNAGVRPYGCTSCETAFSVTSHLARHERSATLRQHLPNRPARTGYSATKNLSLRHGARRCGPARAAPASQPQCRPHGVEKAPIRRQNKHAHARTVGRRDIASL